ncbi:putative phage tail protein [Dysosmobacter sp.]
MKKLIERYQDFYAGSAEFTDLQEALEPELLALWERRDSALAQLNVDTASWGLKFWEQTLGIAVEEEKTVDYRRSRIKSKLRGAGVTTAALIRNVAESFSNGAAAVTEYPSQSRLEIKFIGTVGTPPNLGDLTQTLREILPAHLAWEYIILYELWQTLKGKTWGQLATKTWGEVKEGET